ncbi:hypothetical protein JOF56_008318 [Kibdelosporangium banguiense]|uniref:Lactonase, 7-bladed beta-propeller n=1 Tax=Kibdelosporangium banguiense TaxID=1365924 RepID=A0ABS4TU53_9PSEU|nr:beta-propeller fold lactonase family protein [Kibdelosporangium banguiense]MBP2327933.1 hypothetical protein [Kibdelosporangium banguiense]
MSRIIVVTAAIMLAAVTPAASSTPARRTLYVTNGDSDNVAVSTILASGDLKPVGKPVEALDRPRGIVFAPNGNTAYVLRTGADRIASYRVGARGQLTPFGTPGPAAHLRHPGPVPSHAHRHR